MPIKRTSKNGPTWEAVLSFGTETHVYAGIDEVGRGAWAGPVVAAAVILPFGIMIEGLNDSKKLSPKRRRELDREIRLVAHSIGIGWVTASEVDHVGLSAAVVLSGKRAIESLDQTFDIILLDGSENYLAPFYQSQTLIKGDSILPPISAASIVAKVARDRYMEQLDRIDDCHQFALHKGYGTSAHQAALGEHGITKYHRLSYKPLQKYKNVD